MKLWGEKADPAMHAIHFGYTLGSIFTPLMVHPFLLPTETDVPIGCSYDNATVTSSCVANVTTDGLFVDRSRIEVPYLIAGFITIVMLALFWILYVVGPPKGFQLEKVSRKSTWKDVFNPGSCAQGHRWYGLTLVICLLV